MKKVHWGVALVCTLVLSALGREMPTKELEAGQTRPGSGEMKKAYFAAGCFWGVEAIFQNLPGVLDTTVGYTGGQSDHPTYQEICYDNTGHAEAVEVVYDPKQVSYADLCRYFWRLHDPTTRDRQGPDVGSQYRSAVFYRTADEKTSAEIVKAEAQQHWKRPIVTEIAPAAAFYIAEGYHQDYLKNRGVSHTGCHFLRDW